jgi:pilus assembly protein CpaE
MPVVAVLGAKGGVGASLVATNLALALNQDGSAMLVDLGTWSPSADLLLDLAPARSWADLLPVAGELTGRHMDLAAVSHKSGLRFLAAPPAPPPDLPADSMVRLVGGLRSRFGWIVLDIQSPVIDLVIPALRETDAALVVLTPDPPAIRGAGGLLQALPPAPRSNVGVVVNQVSQFHPVDPQVIARSLGRPLVGVLPRDSRAIGEQVNFGRAAVLGHDSRFAGQIQKMAGMLIRSDGRLGPVGSPAKRQSSVEGGEG